MNESVYDTRLDFSEWRFLVEFRVHMVGYMDLEGIDCRLNWSRFTYLLFVRVF